MVAITKLFLSSKRRLMSGAWKQRSRIVLGWIVILVPRCYKLYVPRSAYLPLMHQSAMTKTSRKL
jgi:hypothetical protein